MSCSGMVLWSKRRTVWDGHLLMKPSAMETEALVSGERGGDREKENLAVFHVSLSFSSWS